MKWKFWLTFSRIQSSDIPILLLDIPSAEAYETCAVLVLISHLALYCVCFLVEWNACPNQVGIQGGRQWGDQSAQFCMQRVLLICPGKDGMRYTHCQWSMYKLYKLENTCIFVVVVKILAEAKHRPLHWLMNATVAQVIYFKYSSIQLEKHNLPMEDYWMTESKR